MQDGKRVQEQVDEMALRAEMRALIAKDHRNVAAERKEATETELAKFKALSEVFTMGQELLAQRKKQLEEAETPPPSRIFDGLLEATRNLELLDRQAQDAILRHEGAFQAFSDFEENLNKEFLAATSRSRGMEVTGARAVAVAESRTGPPPTPEPVVTTAGVLGPFSGPISAKEPMGVPMEKAPDEGSSPA